MRHLLLCLFALSMAYAPATADEISDSLRADLGETPNLGWPEYPVPLHVSEIIQRCIFRALDRL